MLRFAITALLAATLAPLVRADIIHFCFGGVYYQWSTTQNKGINAGSCGRKPWIYLQHTDELLLTIRDLDTAETVERGRRPVSTRPATVEEIARAASAAGSVTRVTLAPRVPLSGSAAAMPKRPGGPQGPPPCPEGQYPPCHGNCWGLPPALCNILGRLPGNTITAAARPTLPSSTGPRTPCPPGSQWNGTQCVGAAK